MTAAIRELAAQLSLEHLADRVAGQRLVTQHDPGGHLERGEPAGDERADVVRACPGPRPRLELIRTGTPGTAHARWRPGAGAGDGA